MRPRGDVNLFFRVTFFFQIEVTDDTPYVPGGLTPNISGGLTPNIFHFVAGGDISLFFLFCKATLSVP